MLLFRVGDAWMLFPGDAQWGTWNSILTDASRSRLLENLTFYKVGHHGSHNATPVSFANRYIKGKVRAMIPYGLGAKWPTIPRQGLIDYLTAQNSPFVKIGLRAAPPEGRFQQSRMAPTCSTSIPNYRFPDRFHR